MIHLRLKELREKAGLSQAEFAKNSRCPSLPSACGRRASACSMIRSCALRKFFHVSTDYLYGHSDSSASNFHFSPAPSVSSIPVRLAGAGPVLAALCRGRILGQGAGLWPEGSGEYRYVRVEEGFHVSQNSRRETWRLFIAAGCGKRRELAIVILAGEEAMLKRVIKDPSNGCISLNSLIPPIRRASLPRNSWIPLLIYGKIAGDYNSF